MRKIIFIFSMLLMFSSRVEANDFHFDFQKGIFSRNYNLKISNQDSNRTISFSGCYNNPAYETSYYVVMKNGTKHYFDSKIFCQIGMKGRFWINSGQSGRIPFKIKKEIIGNAVSIVFEGVTFIPVEREGVVESDDSRKLVVTYNVKTGNVSSEIRDEVLEEVTSDVFKSEFSEELSSPVPDKLDGILSDGKEMEEHRLRRKSKE